MNLPIYQTFTEKAEFFESKKIETETELEEILKQYAGKEDLLFRGMSDSSYKIFSSYHRMCIEHGVDKIRGMHDIIQPFLFEILTWPEINETFFAGQESEGQPIDGANIPDNYQPVNTFMLKHAASILSHMQHNISLSPFVDFTRNILTALYFATFYAKSGGGVFETNGYFSIYAVQKKYLVDGVHRMNANGGYETTGKFYIASFHDSNDAVVTPAEIFNALLGYVITLPAYISYISYGPHFENPNIVAQEGEFIYYKAFEDEPLETRYMKSPTYEHLKDRPKIIALEINKSLLPFALKLLGERAVESFYFPEEYKVLGDKIKAFNKANLDKLIAKAKEPIINEPEEQG